MPNAPSRQGLTLLACLLAGWGCAIERTERLAYDGIYEWYWNIWSVAEERDGRRSGASLEAHLEAARKRDNLGTNWTFETEDLDLIRIDDASFIIDYWAIWRHEGGGAAIAFYRFYFSLESVLPLPLERRMHIAKVDEDPVLASEEWIWSGDFNAYLSDVFDLECRPSGSGPGA